MTIVINMNIVFYILMYQQLECTLLIEPEFWPPKASKVQHLWAICNFSTDERHSCWQNTFVIDCVKNRTAELWIIVWNKQIPVCELLITTVKIDYADYVNILRIESWESQIFIMIRILWGVLHGSLVKCLTCNPGVLGPSQTGFSGFFMGVSLGKTLQSPSLGLVKTRKEINIVSCRHGMTEVMLKAA